MQQLSSHSLRHRGKACQSLIAGDLVILVGDPRSRRTKGCSRAKLQSLIIRGHAVALLSAVLISEPLASHRENHSRTIYCLQVCVFGPCY